MRQACAQRGGARRGRGGHTERALQPPTQAAAPALTIEHYPPLVAAARAGTTGDGVAAAGVHVRGGADGCAAA